MENNSNISEKEKIRLAKEYFAKFKLKIKELFKRQSDVFESIMERINKRKTEEQRRKLDELYKDIDRDKGNV